MTSVITKNTSHCAQSWNFLITIITYINFCINIYVYIFFRFLTNECFKENCTLSHNIVEEKIPFCKHYLNSVCVQLKCPFLHEYREKNALICKNFLHGYCTLGKTVSKSVQLFFKYLNICFFFKLIVWGSIHIVIFFIII